MQGIQNAFCGWKIVMKNKVFYVNTTIIGANVLLGRNRIQKGYFNRWLFRLN